MRLADYFQMRWGLFGLVGGATVLGLVLVGRSDKPKPPAPTAAKAPQASLKGRTTAPQKLTAASVKRFCSQRGVAVNRPPAPNPQAVKHPGFPPPRAALRRMPQAARGLFPLRRRLDSLGARSLAHAPLVHRIARGFAARFHYFAHLSKDRKAARRFYQQQLDRRKRKGLPPAAGTADPSGRAKVPAAAMIALQARGYRRRALKLYAELAEKRVLAAYKRRPAALLEYASLLMGPLPAAQAPRRPRPGKKGAKRPNPAHRRHSAGLQVLHRLLSDHPGSTEAIEALALIAHRTAARGQCAKVTFLCKKLSTAPLPRATTARTAALRGLVHYHAGRCLLTRGRHAAAATRLAAAVNDARVAVQKRAPGADLLAREATVLWAQAYGAAGETSGAAAALARLGPKLGARAKAVLVAQLIKEGQLKTSVALCTPPKPSR